MTPREIAAAVGVSKQAVVKRLRGLKPARLVTRGGHDYDLEQLPASWQEKVRARFESTSGADDASHQGVLNPSAPSPDQGGVPATPARSTPAALVPLFGPEPELPEQLLQQLGRIPTARQQRDAIDLYHLFEPFLPGQNGHGWKKWQGQLLAGGRAILDERDAMLWYAPQELQRVNRRRRADGLPELDAGASPSSLMRWRKRFLAHGLGGLVRRERRDKGLSRILTQQDRFDLASIYLKEGNAKAAWREFCRQKRPVSYSAVKRFIRTLPRPVKVRALKGAKAFNDSCLPYGPRSYEKLQPNDVWVFDHCQLDFFVNAWGKAARPWLTAIMDMKARYIVGWCLSLQPDSLTIASALRMALVECGLPLRVYLDNGKDFRSNYLTGNGRKLPRWRQRDYEALERWGGAELPAEARGIFGRLDIPITYAMVYHPQSKPIERWFATLHKQFDAGWSSYCGGTPGQRPETCQPLLNEHRDCVKAGSPESSPLVPIEQAAFALRAWIGEEYHQQAHGGRGMRRRAPAMVYEPAPAERRLQEAALDVLFLKREPRKVTRGGVTLFDRRYEPENDALFFHDGHEAEVAFDPFGRLLPDTTQVVVYCCGDRFPCRHRQEPETYEQLQDRLRRGPRLKKAVEHAIAQVHAQAQVQSPGERRRVAAAIAVPQIDARARPQALGPGPVDDAVQLEDDGSVALPDYGRHADELMGGGED